MIDKGPGGICDFLGILRARVANLHLWEKHFELKSPPTECWHYLRRIVSRRISAPLFPPAAARRTGLQRKQISKRRRGELIAVRRSSLHIDFDGEENSESQPISRSRAISKSATAAPDAGFCPVMTRLSSTAKAAQGFVGSFSMQPRKPQGFCFSSRGLAARQLESPNPLRQAARGRIEGGLPAEESASLTLGWKPGNFWQQTYQLNSIAALRCAAAISSSSARLSTWAS